MNKRKANRVRVVERGDERRGELRNEAILSLQITSLAVEPLQCYCYWSTFEAGAEAEAEAEEAEASV